MPGDGWWFRYSEPPSDSPRPAVALPVLPCYEKTTFAAYPAAGPGPAPGRPGPNYPALVATRCRPQGPRRGPPRARPLVHPRRAAVGRPPGRRPARNPPASGRTPGAALPRRHPAPLRPHAGAGAGSGPGRPLPRNSDLRRPRPRRAHGHRAPRNLARRPARPGAHARWRRPWPWPPTPPRPAATAAPPRAFRLSTARPWRCRGRLPGRSRG